MAWNAVLCKTYSVLFLDIELEVDGPWTGGGYAELWRWVG